MNQEHAKAVALIEAQMAHYSGAGVRKMPRAEACRLAAEHGFRTGAIAIMLRSAQWSEDEKAELEANVHGLIQWGAMSPRARREALEMIVHNLDIPF